MWIPIYVNLHKSKVNIWICQLNWDNSPPLKLCTLNSNKKSFMADKVLNVFTPNQICRISSTHIFNFFHPCICHKIVHCFILEHLSSVQDMQPTAWCVPTSLQVFGGKFCRVFLCHVQSVALVFDCLIKLCICIDFIVWKLFNIPRQV